jgi:hypothetical protein
MREHFEDKKSFEENALSSKEDIAFVQEKDSEQHNLQLYNIVLRKQKLIIYLSILYTVVIIGTIIYLIFLK